MRKLFLKVYIPLAVCIILTLLFSVFVIVRVIPREIESHRNNVETLQTYIYSSDKLNRNDIETLADSLGVHIQIGRYDVSQPTKLQEPGFTRIFDPFVSPYYIDISNRPQGGQYHFLRRWFWLVLFILVSAEGMVLYFALSPVRKKLSHIKWAVNKFGSGDLGVRVQTAKHADIIDSIGDTFNTMAVRMESLIAAHKDLLGIVAHELRTPLARIRLALELIKESPSNNPEEQKKLQRMEKDITSLDLLVSELLDYNRLCQSNVINRERIDIRELCLELLDAETWEMENIATDVTGCSVYEGDRKLIARSLGNIIRNAVRHTNSRILIKLQETENTLNIIVSDDGNGFDPALKDKLGTPFVKGEESNGTGLGLALTLRIVELHGGTVSFGASGELRGAEIVVSLQTNRGGEVRHT